jgi:hypothetical protein
MKRNLSLLIILCLLTVFISKTERIAFASDSDSPVSYINLNSTVTYHVKHFNRTQNKDASGNYIWDTTTSTQVYSYYKDGRGYWTFQRQQTTNLPEPTSRYFERYIWDGQFVWLYADYFSENGDLFPSQSTATNCHNNPLVTSGCDYVSPAGQEWLKNIAATPSQGTDTSHSILIWDSSTIGTNQGDIHYQGGIVRLTTRLLRLTEPRLPSCPYPSRECFRRTNP